MNRLSLAEEVHVRTWHDGKYVRRPASHFLDFVIDGVSLRQRLPPAGDLVTMLNRAWRPAVVEEAVEVLLGRRPDGVLPSGRVALLACGTCGGWDCGAVTAQLDVADDEIRWSDWRWADYEGEHDLESELGGLTFDRVAYEAAIGGATDRVAQLPYDRLAHEGKRLLWPWQWGWKLR